MAGFATLHTMSAVKIFGEKDRRKMIKKKEMWGQRMINKRKTLKTRKIKKRGKMEERQK